MCSRLLRCHYHLERSHILLRAQRVLRHPLGKELKRVALVAVPLALWLGTGGGEHRLRTEGKTDNNAM